MDLSEVDLFEQQVRPLRLSEAIRRGAKLRPQLRNGLWQDRGASCAIGAAYEADTGLYQDCVYIPAEWLEQRRQALYAYRDAFGCSPIFSNDYGMTREQIADRLEGLGY